MFRKPKEGKCYLRLQRGERGGHKVIEVGSGEIDHDYPGKNIDLKNHARNSL